MWIRSYMLRELLWLQFSNRSDPALTLGEKAKSGTRPIVANANVKNHIYIWTNDEVQIQNNLRGDGGSI